ncbi:MAG: hypothetical protein CTY16_03200 [Methylobacter sp.]|nr:MAG: hypothetical protein CTY16_03200 [Methylobacter sp.]
MLTESERKRIIDNCKAALLSVAPNYFCAPLPGGDKIFSERMFAYEFYHQLRIKFEGESWYVNGEFRKGLTLAGVTFDQLTVIPDIVIHHSGTLKDNIATFEIKVAPKVSASEIIRDLEKLEMYTRPTNGLNFKIGALIMVNQCLNIMYEGCSADEKKRISNLISTYPRIAIWNIPRPISSGSGAKIYLNADCLKIYHKECMPSGLQLSNSIR